MIPLRLDLWIRPLRHCGQLIIRNLLMPPGHPDRQVIFCFRSRCVCLIVNTGMEMAESLEP